MSWLHEEALAVRNLTDELKDEEVLGLSIESETNFVEAVEQVLSAIRDAETLAEAASARAMEIEDRADRFRHRAARLRDVLIGAMATAGRTNLRLAEGTISVCDGIPSAIIVDEAALSPDLITSKTTTRPDMREITRRLRAGEEVPGAVLKNAAPKLQIRIK